MKEIVYEAWSISPFTRHPARNFQHRTLQYPYLIDWQGGKIGEVQESSKPKCPLCLENEMLVKAEKAYRGWVHFQPYALESYIYSNLESQKTGKEIQEEAENL